MVGAVIYTWYWGAYCQTWHLNKSRQVTGFLIITTLYLSFSLSLTQTHRLKQTHTHTSNCISIFLSINVTILVITLLHIHWHHTYWGRSWGPSWASGPRRSRTSQTRESARPRTCPSVSCRRTPEDSRSIIWVHSKPRARHKVVCIVFFICLHKRM